MTTVLKSYRVKPSNPVVEVKKRKLEGLDKNNYFATTIYFGYSNITLPYEEIVEKIKHDLSILQNDFPMIAGSIVNDYEANDAQLIYDGSGVVLVEAENTTTSISDLAIQSDNYDMAAAQVVSKLFTPDIKSLKIKYNTQHFPFVVQITKLKCNSIILTTTNSHMLFDGTSYEMLQKAWKSISQGLGGIKPDDKKVDYEHIDLPSEMPKGWMELPKQFLFQEPAEESQPTPSCRFHFSKEKLESLKQDLNKLIKQHDETKYVTTDEVLSSIIWKAVIKHRKLANDQQTTFIRPTNFRGILAPMISNDSVGNLALMNGISLSAEQLLSLDLLDIIKEIQLQKQRYNKDKILQNLKYFAELPADKSLIMDVVGMAQNDIFINSWSKFTSLATFDIGFGDNVFVSIPPVMNGAALIFPSCSNQVAGFVAHIFLPENILQALRNDTEFIKYLC